MSTDWAAVPPLGYTGSRLARWGQDRQCLLGGIDFTVYQLFKAICNREIEPFSGDRPGKGFLKTFIGLRVTQREVDAGSPDVVNTFTEYGWIRLKCYDTASLITWLMQHNGTLPAPYANVRLTRVQIYQICISDITARYFDRADSDDVPVAIGAGLRHAEWEAKLPYAPFVREFETELKEEKRRLKDGLEDIKYLEGMRKDFAEVARVNAQSGYREPFENAMDVGSHRRLKAKQRRRAKPRPRAKARKPAA